MSNAMMILFPYKHENAWVFDDSTYNLMREPFVFGADTMIDKLVADMPNAQQGFKLIFSQNPFPGYQQKLTWLREECEGNWYTDQDNEEGWLCPAMFHYFPQAPKTIYVKAENK